MAQLPTTARRFVALALALLLLHLPASAGVVVYRGTQGLTLTGTDGVYYDNTQGLTMTGTDALLGLSVNGIGFGATGDGLTMTGTDTQSVAGADGVTYTGANSYTAAHADGLTMTGTDSLNMTSADGLTMTGTDGTVYEADSVIIRQADGLTMTGTDALTLTGVNGLTMTGTDTISFVWADGITAAGAEGVRLDGAAEVVGVRSDGTFFQAPTDGLVFSRVDGLTMTGTDAVWMYGVEGLTMTGTDAWAMTGTDQQPQQGMVGFDPELALALNRLTLERLTDDSNVNAAFVYHRAVTDADIEELQRIGIRGGTRFRVLPVVLATGTANQIAAVSRLPAVRSIYGNRTLRFDADTSRALAGLARARADADLARTGGAALDGTGVGVAVIDTGLDATHPDLAGRVAQNVKLADLQGASPLGFAPPANVENLPNTDLIGGHGTFVGGLVAGSGAASAGRYAGYAPGARLVGLGAGDLSLFHVLAGFDYLLARPDLGVRVVNCSFSANTLYSEHDPVNVATRMLAERGVNVVFSAGNGGPGLRTLNPYAAAPWVISVGATDARGRLADFSARGDFGSRTFRPTLVAGGVGVVSLRAGGANQTGAGEAATGDAQLTADELPYYTTASGTSFSAPQVAGTIALMLQANPQLTPAEVRDILQRTATPLAPYYAHEVGAGMLNAHAAVLAAAFPARHIGLFRAAPNREQVRFVKEPARAFSGTVQPGAAYELGLAVPADAVYASTQVAWGPLASVNDLALSVYDPSGVRRAASNYINLPGLTGKRERTLLPAPAAGAWRVRVSNTLGFAGTPQDFKGVFEIARVEYGALEDLSGLSVQTVEGVRYALRTYSMSPYGSRFHPSRAVTRAEMCAALVAGARVPLYVPAHPTYADVQDATTMNYVESVQAAPGGSFFHDATPGASFRPNDGVTRLVAAIVLVRAAGLEAEAAASSSDPLFGILDANLIPSSWRGHVAVALRRGLISSATQFNPNAAFTRADTARALPVITRLQTE
ncbi:MAG TPA: S8 family serine peptidase [Pyrinomonadaceae bacterium]